MPRKRSAFVGLIVVLGLVALFITQTTQALPTLSPTNSGQPTLPSEPTVPTQATIPPPPALPANFRGLVYVDGEYLAAGTVISVRGTDGLYAQSQVFLRDGQSRYAVNVPEDDPLTPEKDGGSPGEMLEFWIGNQIAEQSSTWESGKIEELNLSIGEAPPTPAPEFKMSLPLIFR